MFSDEKLNEAARLMLIIFLQNFMSKYSNEKKVLLVKTEILKVCSGRNFKQKSVVFNQKIRLKQEMKLRYARMPRSTNLTDKSSIRCQI